MTKTLIRKLVREHLLTEALPDILIDVNLLYDEYFKSDIDNINITGIITEDMFRNGITNTSVLSTPTSVEAHNINPAKIWVNQYPNHYNPTTSSISISISTPALDYLKSINSHKGNGYSLQMAIDTLGGDQKNSFSNEFTEYRIKGSIHHELLHWIDDTLHNKHIKSRLDKAAEQGRDVYFKGKNINMSKFEIQAQMGNIQQIKNKFSDDWDNLTFINLIKLSPPLTNVYNSLRGEDKVKWIKDLKTRMYREGLLGKRMIN